MLLLVNDRRLMGEAVNGPVFNAVAWITVAVMIALTLLLTLDTISPGFLARWF
jgi:Mn2+/Fe2+ NRAMP family transporter